MHYSEFAKLYEELASTTKKLEKVKILSNFLLKLKKEGKSEWIYLLRGRVVPDYDPSEAGISTQLTIKAISKASGFHVEKVVGLFRKKGDLGEIAEELLMKKHQSTLFSSSLKAEKVFNHIRSMMSLTGKGSVERKLDLVSELLTSATGKEAKYIVRTLLNDLRVGVADAILRDSIAGAFFEGENKDAIEEAYDKVNDFAYVFDLAVKGKKYLEKVEITPGRPTKVMLPVKVTNLDEAFRICGKPAAIEHKYDGFRVLINKNGKEISLFTRKLENVTNQFPDIVSAIRKYVKGDSFVLDSEVVGYDPQNKNYMPFEAISQRIKRKYDIDDLIKKLPVEINVFDILYYNGKSVIDNTFYERRKLLEKAVKTERFVIRLSTQFVSGDEKEVEKFYKEALKIGEEGIMVKKLDAPYRPGRRVGYMVKMKPEAADLDLVIVGAEYGKGKRAGGLTSYIVACRSGDKFLEVGMVSSGLKEKDGSSGTTYKEMDSLLRPLITSEKGTTVHVRPKIIVSVTYQNIQHSPTYSSGFALRFPRITHYRPERGTSDIASLEDIKKEVRKTRK